jgi:drug/metabolite transporter superfamily protein YnfA
MSAVFLLIVAALLETGGDAVVRLGLHASSTISRIALFGMGGLILFGYGYLVNAPSWDFGRLLGVYIVFFFVIAQIISWIVFDQQPTMQILIGGFLIVAGGIVISYSGGK